MMNPDCDAIRDRLPDWLAGGEDSPDSSAIRDHLSVCPECRAQEEIIRALLQARPQAPVDLAARIQARVREEILQPQAGSAPAGKVVSIFRPKHRAPTWALSAAALVILSLGIGVIWNGQVNQVNLDPVDVALDEPLPEAWLWDDGMVAGAPVYDGLSDADLEALIQELEG